MPYADPEQVLATWLRTNVFPGAGEDRVRVVTGDDFDLNVQQSMRLIRVVQVPSSPGDAVLTLDIADLEINWYARDRDRVRDLANEARAAMRYQFERTTDAATGAFVKQVRFLSVPAHAPSESSMYFRRVATARLWIHHNPLAPAPS